MAIRIGLISDTHNLLRPQAKACLRGVDHIVHAGDICNGVVLEELARLAPVTAVRGNNDLGPWARALPVTVGELLVDGPAVSARLIELDVPLPPG